MKKTSSTKAPITPAPPSSDEIAKIVVKLVKLLLTPTTTSKDVIDYLERFRINPNIQLPNLQCDAQLPLIYYCVSNPRFGDLFVYLLNHQVQLNVMMVSDHPEQVIELLYYSQIQYISMLIEHGCRLDPEKVSVSVEHLLIMGNINKLIALYKYGAITKEQLLHLLHQKGLIFKVLEQLYEKVFQLSQHVLDEQRFRKCYDELLKNYLNTFKFFFKNGVLINQMEDGESLVQKVLNTYFFSLIQLIVSQGQANWETVELLHYSNFGLTNRQVMKFIYNDANYHQIEEYLREQVPPQKVVIKKVITKKVIIPPTSKSPSPPPPQELLSNSPTS
jgi:hypothetical protein